VFYLYRWDFDFVVWDGCGVCVLWSNGGKFMLDWKYMDCGVSVLCGPWRTAWKDGDERKTVFGDIAICDTSIVFYCVWICKRVAGLVYMDFAGGNVFGNPVDVDVVCM